MSSTARPTLNLLLNATPAASACDMAEGISSATTARKSSPDCTRAVIRLYSCSWCFSPPRRNDAPRMNNVLVTIVPAMDAFTSMYCPARNAASAMTSSARFPSVAFSRPPMASPVLAATDTVARLSSTVNGTIARTDSTKSSVCASWLAAWATNTTGTKASSQSSLFARMSLSSCFIGSVLCGRRRPAREQPADEGEEQPGGQPAHQDAGQSLHRAEQPPLRRQHQVAISHRRVSDPREVERRLRIGQALLPPVEPRPNRDLGEVQHDQPPRHRHEQTGHRPEPRIGLT